MANISLTAGIRANLLSLQGTGTLLGQTQARIGSGKKVASAIDDPTAFFTAQSLSNRASDLTSRLDGISKGVQTVKAASTGITSVIDLLKQAKGVAADARTLATDTSGDAGRSADMVKYATIMEQMKAVAKDSGYDGVNLLKSQDLTVQFAEKAGSSTLALNGFSTTAGTTGGIEATATVVTTWRLGGNTAIDADITKLETSIANMTDQSKTLSSNLATLTTRQTFTKSMVDTLTTGSDILTNADLNTESANMLALNTQNSMGISALSLASQASQGVLKLLG